MRRGIEQRLMLVLAVELDQARRQILQRAGRGESPLMNARLRPCAVISRRTSSSSPPLSKIASMVADVFAGADEVARRAAAEEQADRFDEDRLAGPGFAGQDVQAGVELDLDRVDDREALDARKRSMRKSENSNRNIGLTAISHA